MQDLNENERQDRFLVVKKLGAVYAVAFICTLLIEALTKGIRVHPLLLADLFGRALAIWILASPFAVFVRGPNGYSSGVAAALMFAFFMWYGGTPRQPGSASKTATESAVANPSPQEKDLNWDRLFQEIGESLTSASKKREMVDMLNRFGNEDKKFAKLALETAFDKMRTELPLQIDQFTELTAAYVITNTIKYELTVSGEAVQNLRDEHIRLELLQVTRNQVCTDPRKFFYVMLDFIIVESYYAPDGSLLMTNEVREQDCTRDLSP